MFRIASKEQNSQKYNNTFRLLSKITIGPGLCKVIWPASVKVPAGNIAVYTLASDTEVDQWTEDIKADRPSGDPVKDIRHH